MKRPNITPGPWTAKKEQHPRPVSAHSSATFTRISPGPEGNAIIALVPPIFGMLENGCSISFSNARAIAAVPQLLEALHSLYFDACQSDCGDTYLEVTRDNVKKARAALLAAGYEL